MSQSLENAIILLVAAAGWLYLCAEHFGSFALGYIGFAVIALVYRIQSGAKRRPIVEGVVATLFATTLSAVLLVESWILSDSPISLRSSDVAMSDLRTTWISFFFGWYAGLACRAVWASLTRIATHVDAGQEDEALMQYLKVFQALLMALIPLAIAIFNAFAPKK